MRLAAVFCVLLYPQVSFLAFVVRIFAVLCSPLIFSTRMDFSHTPLELCSTVAFPLSLLCVVSAHHSTLYSGDKCAGRKVTLAKLPG